MDAARLGTDQPAALERFVTLAEGGMTTLVDPLGISFLLDYGR